MPQRQFVLSTNILMVLYCTRFIVAGGLELATKLKIATLRPKPVSGPSSLALFLRHIERGSCIA